MSDKTPSPQSVVVPVRGPGHCDDDAAWAEFVRQYDGQPRSRPDLTDFALANRVFMADRNDLDLIVWQTAAKERIRWLSIELAKAQAALSAAPAPSSLAGGEGRDMSGETVMGMRVAAYRHPASCPPDLDKSEWLAFFNGSPPNTYSEHWSTPGEHRTDVERLFTEADVRDLLAALSPEAPARPVWMGIDAAGDAPQEFKDFAADFNRRQAALTPRHEAPAETLGYLFEDDDGTEWSEADPRVSGENEYATNVRPVTLAMAVAEMRSAWELLSEQREALIQADLKIRSLPGTDQSDVEGLRAVIDAKHEAPAEGAGEEINWKAEWEEACSARIADRNAYDKGLFLARRDSQKIINERDVLIVELTKELEALRARSSAPEAHDVLALCRAISDDYQTSETHHPDHVLVRKDQFDALVSILNRQPEAREEALGNLLAVIHGDGGHRALEVGTKQAALEAEKIVARLLSSAPEAREGETVGVVHGLKADLNTAELPDGTLLYTHPAAPSADKLRTAVEALERVRGWINRRVEIGTTGATANVIEIDQALAALKAEGA